MIAAASQATTVTGPGPTQLTFTGPVPGTPTVDIVSPTTTS